MKRLIIPVILAFAIAASLGGRSESAQAVSPWVSWVRICYPLYPPSAWENDLSQWRTTTVGKTTAAYYRSLGWEVYTVFLYRVPQHLPNIGSPYYNCAQVFDRTIPLVESGWDGVVDP